MYERAGATWPPEGMEWADKRAAPDGDGEENESVKRARQEIAEETAAAKAAAAMQQLAASASREPVCGEEEAALPGTHVHQSTSSAEAPLASADAHLGGGRIIAPSEFAAVSVQLANRTLQGKLLRVGNQMVLIPTPAPALTDPGTRAGAGVTAPALGDAGGSGAEITGLHAASHAHAATSPHVSLAGAPGGAARAGRAGGVADSDPRILVPMAVAPPSGPGINAGGTPADAAAAAEARKQHAVAQLFRAQTLAHLLRQRQQLGAAGAPLAASQGLGVDVARSPDSAGTGTRDSEAGGMAAGGVLSEQVRRSVNRLSTAGMAPTLLQSSPVSRSPEEGLPGAQAPSGNARHVGADGAPSCAGDAAPHVPAAGSGAGADAAQTPSVRPRPLPHVEPPAESMLQAEAARCGADTSAERAPGAQQHAKRARGAPPPPPTMGGAAGLGDGAAAGGAQLKSAANTVAEEAAAPWGAGTTLAAAVAIASDGRQEPAVKMRHQESVPATGRMRLAAGRLRSQTGATSELSA